MKKKLTTDETGANLTEQIVTHTKELMMFTGYGGETKPMDRAIGFGTVNEEY